MHALADTYEGSVVAVNGNNFFNPFMHERTVSKQKEEGGGSYGARISKLVMNIECARITRDFVGHDLINIWLS